MRLRRIKSVVILAWHHLTHSVETWVDIFWFPIIQTAVFASIAFYFARSSGPEAAQYIVLGILLWYAMEAGSYSVAVGMLWEVWARNFSTLFASPLTIGEFIAGQMLFSLVKQCMTITGLAIVAYVVFGFSILSVGASLPIHFLLLMIFGWVVGMTSLAFILRYGTRIQSVAWGLIYIIQPVIGVFYPISIFPGWVQTLAYAIPPTYVFESARVSVSVGTPRWDYLGIALALDMMYLAGGYAFMKAMWERARRAGTLARMEE